MPMLFKIAGLIALFCCCVMAGQMASHRLARRVEQLEALISAVGYISTEIRYNALPVGLLFERLDAIAEYRPLRLFGLCAKRLAESGDLALAWEASLEEAKGSLALRDSDYEALRIFGRQLGTTDIPGQLSLCDSCTGMLRQRLQAARDERAKRGKMYTSLGILTGTFCVILLF